MAGNRVKPLRGAFTPAEAASYAGVSKKIILNACRHGELKNLHLGHRTIRIRPDWLQGWLDEHTRSAAG